MFDLIRKPALWQAWDAGLAEELGQNGRFDLKSIQDLIVLSYLSGLEGKRVAEIGAGHSRVLPRLAAANECVTVEKFEGQGGGPTDAQELEDVRNVSVFLGEMSPELEPDAFDVVYSISVIEHVGTEALADFHEDQLRILKPGGIFVHAIDIYVGEKPSPLHGSRFATYREWVAGDERVEPIGEIYDGELAVSPDVASNPDDVMYSWGQVAPALNEVRMRSQCVSVIVAGRKKGGPSGGVPATASAPAVRPRPAAPSAAKAAPPAAPAAPTAPSAPGFAYAEPREIESPEGLFFYHSIELPGHGLIPGDWDLRDTIEPYLGNVDFAGKRALDMGAATGYLSFAMERLGAADVVSYDIRTGSDWDVVPHYKIADRLDEIERSADYSIERMKDAYWFSHRALGSRARAYYGNIYDLPAELGEFDVVVFGMILPHLRDPYKALHEGAKLCRDRLVLTGNWTLNEQPVALFRPHGDRSENIDIKSWWMLSTGAIEGMVTTLGFEVEDIVESEATVTAKGGEGTHTVRTVVAKRVA